MTPSGIVTVQDPESTENSSQWPRKVAAQAIGLSKTYGEGPARVTALDDVSVEFESGRLTAIMGPSGSGKSTLMHCMAALDAPSAGHVVIDGVDISHLKDKALTRLREHMTRHVSPEKHGENLEPRGGCVGGAGR